MNRFCKTLFIVISTCVFSNIVAQSEQIDYYLKASLSDFLVPFNSSYVLAIEARMPKYSWQLAGGYINNSAMENALITGSDLIEGYRVRLECRRRLFLKNEDRHWLFAGLMAEHLQTARKGSATFCRDDCSFFQIMDYKLSTVRTGLHLTFGRVFTGKRFTLEVGGYVGFRMNYETYKDLPDDATIWREENIGFFGGIERDQWVFLPNTGAQVKLGIKLGKVE